MGLQLVKFNPESGEVEYQGGVDLGGGRYLNFRVHGQVGLHGNAPWAQLVLDRYEGASLDACIARMADWLDAIVPLLRGTPVAGPPIRYELNREVAEKPSDILRDRE